ncbi:MAG TPA: energy transducer TonB [Puia sp.]|nr:energy transducer TonB [Puia sp.]
MKVNRYLFPAFLSVIAVASFGQKNVQSYYDVNGNESSREGAYYFTIINKESDTSWLIAYYNNRGPLRKIEHYRDKKCTVKNGSFAFYNLRGFIDSAGEFQNGNQNGRWIVYGENCREMQEKIYQDGVVTEVRDLDFQKAAMQDSLADRSKKLNEIDSKYPGGESAWQQYIFRNMKIPESVTNDFPNGLSGTVVVGFKIELDGTADDIYILRSRLYELDQQAKDLIKYSGKWIPARKDGIAVRSYKKQPIIFHIMDM